MSYTQLQEFIIAYVIIHRTGEFGMDIHKWNCMTEIQKTCVQCKLFFLTSQQDLRKTSDLTVEYAGINHASIFRDVVAGLQEALQQDQTQI